MFTEGSLSVHRVFTECSLSESQMKAKPSNPLGQKSELLRYDWFLVIGFWLESGFVRRTRLRSGCVYTECLH